MLFRVDVDLLQLDDLVLRRGERIGEEARARLGLRRGRAKTLTNRIHVAFCALAAARVYRSDGCLSVDEIGTLEGWSRDGSVAKLLANEFEFGAGIIQQLGRGGDAQLRLRLPPAEIQVGELPDTVQKLFDRDPPPSAPIEDLRPQPIVDRELAMAVAEALRDASPALTLQVRPAYQGGRSSLVFRGLAVRSVGSTLGHPAASTVLVKVPLGFSAGKLVVNARALDQERKLLASLAGWPGLPARVEQHRIDLRALGDALRRRYGAQVDDDMLILDALVLPLGHPRTSEAEPRLLGSILDETASPMRRLSRRDIHNVLTLAEQLARLLRLLHRERRAHRHLSVDSIIVRYELGIFENVLAPDLAASVQTRKGSDDLLYGDLFDLGRVLAHVITGVALSRERQNFQPPEFPGRRLLKRAVVGEGETVARLLFCVNRYLLEASPGPDADHEHHPTVSLLDHFLDELEHIDMLHWSRARGVPERRVSLAGATSAAPQSPVPAREVWERSTADPVATRLVTISHLVGMSTLRLWCERYVTNHRWYVSITARRDTVPGGAPSKPSVEDCLNVLRDGFGRSAAEAMWRYLWNAGPEESTDDLVRIVRNYATHWAREGRFDVTHSFEPHPPPDGRSASRGTGDELDALRQRWAGQPDRQLLVDWIDVVKLLSPRNRGVTEQRRVASMAAERAATERAAAGGGPVAREYERLRSWLRAGALMQQLQSRTVPPAEKDILALERTLQARSAPEIAFWHVLLARAWAAAAAHGARAETGDKEPAWDKAMRALLVAAGIASSRKLPFEMAATLLAAAMLTRLGLSTPELRAGFSSQGVDEESVRVQAAECALLAADAYQWLDAEHHHGGALLEAAWLLQGSAFPERLIQAFQLIALARNNRVLYRAHHRRPDDRAADPPPQFERYPLGDDSEAGRIKRERLLFDETYRAWVTAAGRSQTSDDPGTVVAQGYFATYLPGVRQLFRSSSLSSSLQIELDAGAAKPARAVDRLLELVGAHHGPPAMDRILDFGCGAGDDARYLARRGQVWAVDSPLWFAASRGEPAAAVAAVPRFIELDPVEYARRICDDKPPEGSPAELDIVLFRCSLCRIRQRALLLQAAYKLLRPGGLVVATDWIQTRVTDRITWSRIVGTGRFVDLETEPGYRRLCSEQGFTDFASWDWTAEPDATAPAMHRWFQSRLEEVRKLEDERGRPPRSSYERAFLLRLKRDLEAFAALSTAEGPLGWLFWAARRPTE